MDRNRQTIAVTLRLRFVARVIMMYMYIHVDLVTLSVVGYSINYFEQ